MPDKKLFKSVPFGKYNISEVELLHQKIVANETILFLESAQWRQSEDWEVFKQEVPCDLSDFVKYLKSNFDINVLRFSAPLNPIKTKEF